MGGHGIVRSYEFSQAATVSILSDRRKYAPYGLRGGKKGKVGQNILISKGREYKLPFKTTINVNRRDIISILTPGGGGYGKVKRSFLAKPRLAGREDYRENEKIVKDKKTKIQ